MKRFSLKSGIITSALTMAVVLVPATTQLAFAAEPVTPTVSVSGQGHVMAAPDRAMMSVTLDSAQQKTAAEAKKKVNDQLATLQKTLSAYGVTNKDIQTTWYSVYPQYDYSYAETKGEPATQKIIGYTASRSVTVTLKDVKKVSEAFDKLLDANFSNIGGINYDIKDNSAYIDKAREAAVKNAADKAGKLAKLMNFKLGKVQSVYENQSYNGYSPMYNSMGYGSSIEPMDLDVTLDLNVTYELVQ